MNIFIKKKLLNSIFWILLCSFRLYSAKIDTISIPSQSMGKSYSALLVLPDSHKFSAKKYPVLYLLHGHSGHFTGWFDIASKLSQWADLYQMIIVCPDGDYDSWYLNSPVQKNRKFETYFSEEIVRYIDSHYKTINRPESRGISGVSMGGHGAIYLALKHPEVFGLAGSSSGAMDLLPFYNHWNLETLLGSFAKHQDRWKAYSCYYLLDKMYPDNDSIQNPRSSLPAQAGASHLRSSAIRPRNPRLWLDCGTEDFFLEVNRKFHKKLLDKNIQHEYLEKQGGHTLEYWKDSYQKQILFFVERFKR